MPLQHFFILISSILVFLSYIAYDWSILTGGAKPHRTTRFVLLLITILGTSSLFASHDTVAIWLIGISAVNCIVVFALSLKYGMGGWAPSDIICLLIALVGIVTWRLTDNPALGLYAAVVADFAGMIPTLIKTYRYPDSEYGLMFLLDVSADSLILLAITNWQFQNYLYPLYLLIINMVMTFLTQRMKNYSALTKLYL